MTTPRTAFAESRYNEWRLCGFGCIAFFIFLRPVWVLIDLPNAAVAQLNDTMG